MNIKSFICGLGLLLGMPLACADSPPQTVQANPLPLPELPALNHPQWFELYISPVFSGKAMIFLDSIQTAPDGSIHYVLNQRSAAGSDNISAEAMICLTGNQLFGSDGAQYNVFAYADASHQRWIEPRRSTWKSTGNKLTATHPVRQVLYDAFCSDGKAKNDDALRQRVRQKAGRTVQRDYSK